MHASKENAQKALAELESLVRQNDKGTDYRFVREFIEAASRKLPSEAAFEKEKARKSDKPK